MLVIGRTDTVVGTEVDTLMAIEITVPVPLITPATLAASEGVEVTVGKTVAVGALVWCYCYGSDARLGACSFYGGGGGGVVGFIVAVGGTRDTGGADVTLMLDGTSESKNRKAFSGKVSKLNSQTP